jgi:hypothetical protein
LASPKVHDITGMARRVSNKPAAKIGHATGF